MKQQVPFADVAQMLTKHFGTRTATTREVMSYIRSHGIESGPYYGQIKNTYSVGHGLLQFQQDTESDEEFGYIQKATIPVAEKPETEQQIADRINKRFNALDIMARATAKGINRSMIVSGPAGLGKSYGVERAAEEIVGDFAHVKGYIRPTGLYKTLYNNRHPGNLIVFDDIDSIFADENCLNLLKAACDSSDVRRMSWLSNSVMIDEDGEEIPSTFEFQGSVIFITNICFQSMIDRGSKMAPHFEALISRSHFLDLGIKNKRDYMVRIKQVMNSGMLDAELVESEKSEIIQFMEENIDSMRELSLRMVKKLGQLFLMDRTQWKDLARITCMRNN